MCSKSKSTGRFVRDWAVIIIGRYPQGRRRRGCEGRAPLLPFDRMDKGGKRAFL